MLGLKEYTLLLNGVDEDTNPVVFSLLQPTKLQKLSHHFHAYSRESSFNERLAKYAGPFFDLVSGAGDSDWSTEKLWSLWVQLWGVLEPSIWKAELTGRIHKHLSMWSIFMCECHSKCCCNCVPNIWCFSSGRVVLNRTRAYCTSTLEVLQYNV